MTKANQKLRALFLAALMVFSVVGGTVALGGTAVAANTATGGAGNSGSIQGDALDPAKVTEGTVTNNHLVTFTVTNVTHNGNEDTVNVTFADELATMQSFSVNGVMIENASDGSSISDSSSPNIVDGPDNDGVDDTVQFGIQSDMGNGDVEFQLDVTTEAPEVSGDTQFGINASFVDNGADNVASKQIATLTVVDTDQTQNGFLSGRVSDQSNNDVPNATVRAVRDSDNLTATTQTNSQGEFTLELPNGTYDITVERQGFSTATSKDNEINPNQTTTANLVITRNVNADNISIEASSPTAVANGEEQASYTVRVTTDDLQNPPQPLENTEVVVSVTGADNASAVDFPSGMTLTTDANGEATFTLNSTEVQDVALEFEATQSGGDSVTTTATASFIPQEGEGVFLAQVKDLESAMPLENATVYAVRSDRFSQNTISINVSSGVSQGDESLFRVVNTTTGEPVPVEDYRVQERDSSDFTLVDQLNETDAGVGSGFSGVAGTTNAFEFDITPIEAGNYTVQRTTVTENPADSDFSNVTTAAVEGNFTAEAIATRDADAVGLTNQYGQVTLTNLVADGKNGVNYTVVAQRPDHVRQYQSATIQSYDSVDERYEQTFLLEEREVQPDSVNLVQVGTHPPLSETGGAPDTDLITEFNDTSDDVYQQVPRDGTVDVISVSASATNFQGDETAVDANVTVSLNETFDGQFLGTVLSGEVVNNDQENATITVSTGADGQATVLLETEQNGSTLRAAKMATLESDSTVTDSSNVIFVGTTVYDTGSVSGIVTNEHNEPLPNSVVYVNEFVDAAGNTYTIEPVTSLTVESREEALEAEFIITDETSGESITVTGEQLQSLELGSESEGFTRISLNNTNAVTLLTFPSDRAQYTLPRVPATEGGVDYTRVEGVQFATGDVGVGDANDVRVDFTQEANIVIVGAEPIQTTFEVSDLEPQSATVEQGTTVTVNATVTNDGVVASTQDVSLVLDGEVQETQSVSLDARSNTTVSFTVNTSALSAGDYTHSVVSTSDETGVTGTLTIENSTDSGTTLTDVLTTIEAYENGNATLTDVLSAISEYES